METKNNNQKWHNVDCDSVWSYACYCNDYNGNKRWINHKKWAIFCFFK